VIPAAKNPDSTAFVRLAKSMTELLTAASSASSGVPPGGERLSP
jgi:hypothetical protein